MSAEYQVWLTQSQINLIRDVATDKALCSPSDGARRNWAAIDKRLGKARLIKYHSAETGRMEYVGKKCEPRDAA